MHNINTIDLDNVTGGVATARTTTNDALLQSLTSLQTTLQSNLQNQNNGTNNLMPIILALAMSKRGNSFVSGPGYYSYTTG